MPTGRAAILQDTQEAKWGVPRVAGQEEEGTESLLVSWSCHVTRFKWTLDFLLYKQTEPIWEVTTVKCAMWEPNKILIGTTRKETTEIWNYPSNMKRTTISFKGSRGHVGRIRRWIPWGIPQGAFLTKDNYQKTSSMSLYELWLQTWILLNSQRSSLTQIWLGTHLSILESVCYFKKKPPLNVYLHKHSSYM